MKFLGFALCLFLVGCAPVKTAQADSSSQSIFKVVNSGTLRRVGPYAFLHIEDIDRDGVMAVVLGIQEAEKQSLPVLLEVDSQGGSVVAGQLLMKVIERTEVKVRCMIDGNAYSMGLFFLAACDERVATARSSFMFHQPLVVLDTKGFPEKILNEYEELSVIWRELCLSTASFTKISFDTCIAKTAGGRQWFLDAKQALDLGIIDEIVKPVRPLK